jgi:DNA replicative helicase MCM subunit Mcm2 (Cdc46/Mcm family)
LEHIEKLEEAKKYLRDNLLSEERIKINDNDQLDQDKLRKYIIYAKKYIHPKLNEIDKEKVT